MQSDVRSTNSFAVQLGVCMTSRWIRDANYQRMPLGNIYFFSGSSSTFRAQVFIQFLNLFSQTVVLLGRVIRPSQGLYLNTGQHKHRINAYTHQRSMPLSGIRTHYPSVRANEDSSYLRPRGYCDRLR
jgi:hypothetical protein